MSDYKITVIPFQATKGLGCHVGLTLLYKYFGYAYDKALESHIIYGLEKTMSIMSICYHDLNPEYQNWYVLMLVLYSISMIMYY